METIFINEGNLRDFQKQAVSKIIALGFFDGLHAGHRQVIAQAKKLAKQNDQHFAVMSFTPHPKVVLSNGNVQVPQIMNFYEKQHQLEKLGVDTLYMIEFTKEFAALSPQQFVKDYLLDLKVVHVVAGFDFTYGQKGHGNLDRMVDDAKGQLSVTKVKKVVFAGEKISSSCIRAKLINGEVDMMPFLLGDFYETTSHWNGVELIPSTECLVPGNGKYSVVITNGKKRLQTEVIIKDGQYLCPYRIPPSFIGNVRLKWKKQIYAEQAVQSN